MIDIFAALDAAIARFDRPSTAKVDTDTTGTTGSFEDFRDTSRSSRDGDTPEGATGTVIPLINNALPVVPVVPAKNREVVEESEHLNFNCGGAPQFEDWKKSPTISFSENEEITGSTGSLEDSRRQNRSRWNYSNGNSTGTTGSDRAAGFPLPAVVTDALGALCPDDPDIPPGDVPPHRWAQFLADVRDFLDSGFSAQAEALGWTAADLYGCDETKPYARIDRAGLLWLLNGDRLVAITADAATIETRTGAWQTYRRKAEPL